MPLACDLAGAARRLARHVRALARRRDGGVAPMFGLALIPLVFAVGAGIDYSLASRARAKLDAIADAAALSAVNKAAMALAPKDAEAVATTVFNAQAQTVDGVKVKTVSVKVTDTKKDRAATISYTATVPTYFAGMIGLSGLSVGGTASAASTLPTYIDFYLLLDNTPSMGVGATTADIDKMVANTSDKCAFACHDLASYPNDYYGLAKKLGVQMRIDVVRQATQQLMDTATTTASVPNQFRMAIYTFGAAATSAGLAKVQSITSNLSKAKTAASAIDIMTVPYQNYASDTLTSFHSTIPDVNNEISTPGDGLNSSTPQKVLFFVSDGVADRAIGSPACAKPTSNGADAQTGKPYVRCQEPLDVGLCTTLKNRGIKIAVLYTTYLPLPTNSWYTSWIAPFQSDIAKNMEACASPGLYFEVSPNQGIAEAMTALFQKAVQQARLTK